MKLDEDELQPDGLWLPKLDEFWDAGVVGVGQ